MAAELRDQLQTALGDGYTINRELGGGGMSIVFVAEERTLGREIVVKVLPPDRAATVSIQRFKREIQLAARLQHPHIVPLLSAGDADGLPYYTMPFVKGESLRVRLARSGELSINETLHILRDIASALAYAHGEGVIHRDIKPDNVIVSGGVAVVTDFGVAKAMDLAVTEAGGTAITSLGIALGTPAYMAPEQATAESQIDHRADIYSFGCLAYELLAGSSPFAGRPLHQMLAAQVTETPEPLARRRPSISSALATLVMHCLEKRPGDRPQSATEILAALDAIGTPSGDTSPTQARLPAVRGSRVRWVVPIVAIAIVVGTGLVLRRAGSAVPYRIGATTPIATSPALEWHPAISPDGRFVAYSMRTPQGFRVFVRQTDGGRPVMVASDPATDQDFPAWAPDGTRLLFIAKGSVYVVPALGGTPRVLFRPPPNILARVYGAMLQAVWSPDGKWIAYSSGGIWIGPSEGGASRLAARGAFHHSPAWSPDGRQIAYVDGAALTIGNISASAIWIAPADSTQGKPTRITDELHVNETPAWTPDGRSILFVSSLGGTLDVYQQALTAGGSAASGTAVRLTTGLSAFTISLSRDGTRLAHDVVRTQSNVAFVTTTPGRVASVSEARAITNDNQIVESLNLSPDGKWIAYDSNLRGNYDVYKVSVDGGDPIQLTSDAANDFAPDWSPNGNVIAFHSTRIGGVRQLFVMSADGGNEQVITSGAAQHFFPSWSPDGSRIAFASIDTVPRIEVIARGADGHWTRTSRSVRIPHLNWPQANWSPDGSSLAVTTAGSVWVLPANGGAPRVAIDQKTLGDSAQTALWAARDATTLYVSALTQANVGSIWAVPFGRPGRPRKVVSGDASNDSYTSIFDTDGRRFYFAKARIEGDVSVIELRR